MFWPGVAPLELRIVGRTLLQAALVGGVAGVLGAAFFAALEVAQRLLLEGITGYAPLRAYGETYLRTEPGAVFRPVLLALMPALGGLVSGVLTSRFAPEAAGGGGNAIVETYHRGGVVRRRVLAVKAAAAIATLASGGSGGREGPTMQIGGAIGALVGRYLPTSARERRILIVAGIAAGIAAVFRTPLGAALLATEMLYRDDFESDALVPAILASVIAYSIVISLFGETTLFGHPQRFPFIPYHLFLYGILALAVALCAVAFIRTLHAVEGVAHRSPLPLWLRPALGGLAMGVLGTAVVVVMARHYGPQAARLGVFGGGYGAAQVAISGGSGLPGGWGLVRLLALLFVAKMLAASLTIGSGGAAGDFAPSLVMGGLVGSAFGHAASLLLQDPTIDPAAFALVGMGTFYGGVAHAPLSALVLVSELAGSYDLLVPMMLAVSIAFVALRNWTLYPAQRPTKADSPTVRAEATAASPGLSVGAVRARDVQIAPEVPPIAPSMPTRSILEAASAAHAQKVLVVTGAAGAPAGLVPLASAQMVADHDHRWVLAADLMVPFAAVSPEDTLADVSDTLQDCGLPQVPVVDGTEILGYVGEAELAHAFGRNGQRKGGAQEPRSP
jgi:CIC family chloride channel protein